METFVYICRRGINEELRYSIRSVLYHFPNADIYVVGEPPDWYIGKSIYVPQNKDKYNNAGRNLATICVSEEIPDDIILMNDDFFIVDKVKSINYYHGGLLVDKIKSYSRMFPSGPYIRKLSSTLRRLKQVGVENPLDYELHVPMRVNKQKLQKLLQFGVLWRSLYGNIYNVGGTEIVDVKVYFDKTRNPHSFDYTNRSIPFLSSEDMAFPELKAKIIGPMFPKRSKLESKEGMPPLCPHCGSLL